MSSGVQGWPWLVALGMVLAFAVEGAGPCGVCSGVFFGEFVPVVLLAGAAFAAVLPSGLGGMLRCGDFAGEAVPGVIRRAH